MLPRIPRLNVANRVMYQGEAGDNMGVLLRGLKREAVERGQVIAAPGSIQSVKKCVAQIYVCWDLLLDKLS